MSQQRTPVPAPRRPVAGSLPQQATPTTIGELIQANAKALAAILPKSLTLERFARIALTSIERNPKLAQCTPQSLLSCILQAAAVGLEVDNPLGHAYLVPFWDKNKSAFVCTLILGYKGLVTLMHRAGKVTSVEVRAVREGDVFEYEYGLNRKLVHRPQAPLEAPVTHTYAIVRLTSGDYQFEVWDKARIDRTRARSRAATSGPWVTDWEEMAMKCPLRHLSKTVPMSAEEARVVAADELVDAGLDQAFSVFLETPNNGASPPAASGREPPPAGHAVLLLEQESEGSTNPGDVGAIVSPSDTSPTISSDAPTSQGTEGIPTFATWQEFYAWAAAVHHLQGINAVRDRFDKAQIKLPAGIQAQAEALSAIMEKEKL